MEEDDRDDAFCFDEAAISNKSMNPRAEKSKRKKRSSGKCRNRTPFGEAMQQLSDDALLAFLY